MPTSLIEYGFVVFPSSSEHLKIAVIDKGYVAAIYDFVFFEFKLGETPLTVCVLRDVSDRRVGEQTWSVLALLNFENVYFSVIGAASEILWRRIKS